MIDRQVFVGQYVDISAAFVRNGVPIQPQDDDVYPNYAIKDAYGSIICVGKGDLAPDGLYHANFTVPSNAVASTVDHKWTLDWEMVDTNGDSFTQEELFDVAIPDFSLADFKEQQKLVLVNFELPLVLPLPAPANDVKMYLSDTSGINTLSNPLEAILDGMYSDFYAYKTTIPAGILKARTDYIAMWRADMGVGSINTNIVKVHCVDMLAMSLISDLRMYLDKVLKPLDVYTGYRDSDLYYALLGGINYMNNVVPLTGWTIYEVYSNVQLRQPLIMAAAWWALSVQFLAEVDSTFSFGSQSVSLEVDRSSQISEAADKLKEWLDNGFKEMKKQLMNQGNGFHLALSYPTVGSSASADTAAALGVGVWR